MNELLGELGLMEKMFKGLHCIHFFLVMILIEHVRYGKEIQEESYRQSDVHAVVSASGNCWRTFICSD
jgi:hypothetical protein